VSATAAITASPADTVDPYRRRLETLDPETIARVRGAFLGLLRREHAIDLDACVRCGLCTGSCHYAIVDDDPQNSPAYKVTLVAQALQHETAWFPFLARWSGGRPLDAGLLAEWVDVIFGRCTMCGRCTANCVVGIDVLCLGLGAVARASGWTRGRVG